MTAVTVATKPCSKCGETKALTEFYVNRSAPDGRAYWCKVCQRQAIDDSKARMRSEMGEEAWRAHVASATRRHRERTGDPRGPDNRAAYRAALSSLRENHRSEFDRLLAIERYERGLE